MLSHEFHHLILNGIALGILCSLLHVRAMFAQFLVLLLVGTAATLGISGEQAVHQRVGIAAYRTRKVGVIVECKPKVANVVHAVTRLHHSPQSHGLYEFLLWAVGCFVHKLIDTLGNGTACALRLYLIAELHHVFAQRFHLLWVGIVVYTVRQGLGFLALLCLPYALCHGAVGQQHELLDELVGILRPLKVA